jgi:hypothetical protein
MLRAADSKTTPYGRAGRAFFPEKVDPPAPTVVERIPFGYVKDEDAFAYQEKMRRRDAEAMGAHAADAPSEDAALANSDFSTFNFEFDRLPSRCARERADGSKEAAAGQDRGHKKRLPENHAEDPDPA